MVSLAVPPDLADAYRFTQGQFLTLRARLDGEELRRSYSICSGVQDDALRVAIKRVDGGRFSAWANDALRPGDALEVMTPDGRFFTPIAAANRKHYVAFAAGSGITPVLSLIKTTLAAEPASRATLVYGNRFVKSIMFCDELEDLKDRYLGRFALYHVLSRDHQEVDLFNGRIDRDKCAVLFDTLLPAADIDEAFVCGPAGMIDAVKAALEAQGLPSARIHGALCQPRRVLRRPRRASARHAADADGSAANVTVIADGKQRHLRVPYDGEKHSRRRALRRRRPAVRVQGRRLLHLPRQGRRRRGPHGQELRASRDREIERGFVLTCQSHPATERGSS